MSKDIWHFPRTELAQQVLGMFESGLSSALVFFAPRRMGKTEFLRKDIFPLAEKNKWKVFYFSFLDSGSNVQEEYTQALAHFAETIGAIHNKNSMLSRIRKMGAEAGGIKASVELDKVQYSSDMKSIFENLAKQNKILLLMDEVQVLAKNERNDQFIAGLRTVLDTNKDVIKAIFTGSSREGLRTMFSTASAPFFHFGQNLNFPELGLDFIKHLAAIFQQVTKRHLNEQQLWRTFQEMDKVPQLARALVERLALNPGQTITKAKTQLLTDIFSDRAFVEMWHGLSKLEQLLLKEISVGPEKLFAEAQRAHYAKVLGVKTLTVPAIQSALRVLQRRNLIGKTPDRAGYFIDDPNFKSWLQNLE